MFTKQRQNAYSLLEVLVVLGIVGLLAALLLPTLSSSRRRAQDTSCLSNLKSLTMAMDMYRADYDGHYPLCLTGNIVDHKGTANTLIWNRLVQPYLLSEAFPVCPLRAMTVRLTGKDVFINDFSGYAMNTFLNKFQGTASYYHLEGTLETALRSPACTITVFEARTGIFYSYKPDLITTWDELFSFAHRVDEKYFAQFLQQTPGALRHYGGANYLFADGHVQWLLPTAIRIEPTSDGITPGFGI